MFRKTLVLFSIFIFFIFPAIVSANTYTFQLQPKDKNEWIDVCAQGNKEIYDVFRSMELYDIVYTMNGPTLEKGSKKIMPGTDKIGKDFQGKKEFNDKGSQVFCLQDEDNKVYTFIPDNYSCCQYEHPDFDESRFMKECTGKDFKYSSVHVSPEGRCINCETDDDCGSNLFCSDEGCVKKSCNSDDECPTNSCNKGVCFKPVKCLQDSDCVKSQSCIGSYCLDDLDNDTFCSDKVPLQFCKYENRDCNDTRALCTTDCTNSDLDYYIRTDCADPCTDVDRDQVCSAQKSKKVFVKNNTGSDLINEFPEPIQEKLQKEITQHLDIIDQDYYTYAKHAWTELYHRNADLDNNPLFDCDDTDPEISPFKNESCDLKDNDCDGVIDECDEGFACTYTDTLCHELDHDGDGYNNKSLGCPDCFDCNDSGFDIHPGAAEIPNNNIDDNCNGFTDEDDSDGDIILDQFEPEYCIVPVLLDPFNHLGCWYKISSSETNMVGWSVE